MDIPLKLFCAFELKAFTAEAQWAQTKTFDRINRIYRIEKSSIQAFED